MAREKDSSGRYRFNKDPKSREDSNVGKSASSSEDNPKYSYKPSARAAHIADHLVKEAERSEDDKRG